MNASNSCPRVPEVQSCFCASELKSKNLKVHFKFGMIFYRITVMWGRNEINAYSA